MLFSLFPIDSMSGILLKQIYRTRTHCFSVFLIVAFIQNMRILALQTYFWQSYYMQLLEKLDVGFF